MRTHKNCTCRHESVDVQSCYGFRLRVRKSAGNKSHLLLQFKREIEGKHSEMTERIITYVYITCGYGAGMQILTIWGSASGLCFATQIALNYDSLGYA